MTTPSLVAADRAPRWVWLWCLAYTGLTPAEARQRRRSEIRSHLWESAHAGLSTRAVAFAALRGLLSDVTWTLSSGLPALGRSFGTPTPYVVLAPLFPIEGWIVSALFVGRAAHIGAGVGALGGGTMLLVAGVVWLIRRSAR